MALSNDLASSPSAGNSPASLDSLPDTPISPSAPVQTLALPASDANANAVSQPAPQTKRKPSRRANTAERRATHNAVERQRRETLNGRFLDLAALLPNLSQIRRPSKSAIVNSSIAHIHSSRRHRAMASRELRLLKLEADALRRELNEWRDRASLPRVEEPVRSDAFSLVLSGEVEILPVVATMDEDDEEAMDDDFPSATPIDDPEAAYLAKAYPTQVVALPRAHPVRSGPIIASAVPSVAYENPAMPPAQQQPIYEPIPPHYQQQQLQHQYSLFDDKHAWSSQLLAAQQQIQFQAHQQAQQGYLTPPSSANAYTSTPPSTSYGTPPAFFSGPGHLYGSPVEDTDVSSIASGRTRSGSLGAAPQPSFDLASATHDPTTTFQKRLSGGSTYANAFPLMM